MVGIADNFDDDAGVGNADGHFTTCPRVLALNGGANFFSGEIAADLVPVFMGSVLRATVYLSEVNEWTTYT